MFSQKCDKFLIELRKIVNEIIKKSKTIFLEKKTSLEEGKFIHKNTIPMLIVKQSGVEMFAHKNFEKHWKTLLLKMVKLFLSQQIRK